ncbi:MAG: TonB-dependent receptor [Myxococcota bacterium]
MFSSVLSFLLLNVEVAQAIETGNIQGLVEDESGVPVPGAEVVMSGAELAGERRMTTAENGVFRFDGLSPGTYDLVVLFKGATVARAEVRVALGTTTNATIPAKMGGVSEELEVIGIKPVIDTTSSSFGSTLGSEQIHDLPVGRNYQSVVETIPGVSGRVDTSGGGEGNGNPSVRGEGQYGNNYFIDGVSTRDPATKTFGQSVNFDAIENIQVYTDGAPAEFGQFTGMVVNVVTKDGGDEHHGSAAIFYGQHAFFDKEYPILNLETAVEEDTVKQRSWAATFAGTAGGPIIKEKLWYFASLDLAYGSLIPEGVTEGDPIKTRSVDFLGKLTWFPTAAWTLRYQFGASFSPQPNFDLSQFVTAEAASNRTDWDQSHRLTATLSPDDKNTLEIKLGYLNTNIDILPTLDDDTVPSYQDAQGALHGNAYNVDLNDRNRFGGGLTYTRFLERLGGEHRIKAGADAYVLLERREIVNTGRLTDFVWQQDPDGDGIPEDDPTGPTDVGTRYGSGPGFDCTNPNPADPAAGDCYSYEHWTNVGPLDQTVFTYSAFLQDDWQPLHRLTINAGVRADIEDGRNDLGERPQTQLLSEHNLPADDGEPPAERQIGEFGPIAGVAPRIGFSLDPFDDTKTKVSGHYGWYYDLAGNGLWQWSNTRSASGFVRYIRDLEDLDGDGDTNEFRYSNTQDPVSSPLIYAEDLKPPRQEKFNLGIEREVIKDMSVGIRGILSRTKNLPEDIQVDYGLDGTGNDWYIMNSEHKYRQYRALELTVNKQFDDVWQLYGAYTLSESIGTTPGQFELAPGATSGSDGNNVGVYLDDLASKADRALFIENGLGFYLQGFKGLGHCSPLPEDDGYCDEAGWNGYLPYHSFHMITLNGSYTAPFGTTFGLVYEFDSGHAWQKRTDVPFYGPGNAFGQGRGSRMMPAVHYVDFRVAHKIGLGNEHRSLEASLDVFNLPGFAQSITYFENDAPGFGYTLYRQAPRQVRLGLNFQY